MLSLTLWVACGTPDSEPHIRSITRWDDHTAIIVIDAPGEGETVLDCTLMYPGLIGIPRDPEWPSLRTCTRVTSARQLATAAERMSSKECAWVQMQGVKDGHIVPPTCMPYVGYEQQAKQKDAVQPTSTDAFKAAYAKRKAEIEAERASEEP